MKKYFLSMLLIAILISCKIDSTLPPEAKLSDKWDGSSYTQLTSENGVYRINYPSQLAWIAKTANDGYDFANETVILMNNIDLSGKKFPGIAVVDGTKFMGVFNGNGFAVKNLNIESDKNNVGFIGYLETNGTVKNLNLEGNISATSSGIVKVGSVVGINYGIITNVTNAVEINAVISQDSTGASLAYIGGIVGMNNSSVSESVNKGNITATVEEYAIKSSAGGIAGWLGLEASISKCYNSGKIESLQGASGKAITYIGGLAGNVYTKETPVTISKSYNVGDINCNAQGSAVGGLLGNVEKGIVSISDSYNTGDMTVSVSDYVGGLVGKGNSTTTIATAYNIGDMSSSTAANKDEIANGTGITTTSVYYLSAATVSSSPKGLTANDFALYSSFTDFNFTTVWTMSKGTAIAGKPETRPVLLGVGYYLPPIPAPPIDVPR